MKETSKILVLCFSFAVVLLLGRDCIADNSTTKGTESQLNGKIAFVIATFDSALAKNLEGDLTGKDISGRVQLPSGSFYRGSGYDDYFVCYPVSIHPADHKFSGMTEEEYPVFYRSVTWEEFCKTSNYKNKRLSYVSIEMDFPMSLAGWELDRVDFLSDVDINDARLYDCTVRGTYPCIRGLNRPDLKEWSARNDKFNFFASTWNYKYNSMRGINLIDFDLRKANFAGKNVAHMFIDSLTHDKRNPNVDLFKDATIADESGKNILPIGISKEQFYRTKNYKEKSLCGLILHDGKHNVEMGEQVDLNGQDLTGAKILGSLSRQHPHTEILNDAIIKNATILVALKYKSGNEKVGFMNEKQLYSTQSYKQGDLTNITFTGDEQLKPLYGNVGVDNGSTGDMKNWNLSRKNLSNCKFERVDLTDANFTDAVITGAIFGRPLYKTINNHKVIIDDFEDDSHLTIDQIKSTWNYKNGLMSGVMLPSRLRRIIDMNK
jgi:uncharacterized protein YjbI with pentapeptide repeats